MCRIIELKKLLGGAAILLAVLIPGALYLGLRSSGEEAVLETGAWGLSFQTQGQPPVANATADELGQYDAAYIGDTGEKTIYLTFDCGYENGNTETILNVLKAHNAKAAFFVVGNYLETEPDLVKRMAEEGHTVGNHTWSHPDMSAISDLTAFQEQLGKVEAAYETITGQEMSHYYRPPQGVYSQENLKMAQELGYQTVFWSLAYVDWKVDDQPSEAEAMEKLTSRIHNGAVVLLHNTSSTNGAILDRLLTAWEDMGYCFGTLDELFSA
jgi:peptidoglycan-N-acetylmuramic acid deacetylase